MTAEPDLIAFIRESNRIEGITRAPTKKEIEAHVEFLNHDELREGDLRTFVWKVACQPIREGAGQNVRVGNHLAPPGGPEIVHRLVTILDSVNAALLTAWEAHRLYETLHPFMDGNGRSGRVLWLWQMQRQSADAHALKRGFLHTFYYQTLGEVDR